MARGNSKKAQDGFKMASGWLSDGFRMAPDGSKKAQDGSKQAKGNL